MLRSVQSAMLPLSRPGFKLSSSRYLVGSSLWGIEVGINSFMLTSPKTHAIFYTRSLVVEALCSRGFQTIPIFMLAIIYLSCLWLETNTTSHSNFCSVFAVLSSLYEVIFIVLSILVTFIDHMTSWTIVFSLLLLASENEKFQFYILMAKLVSFINWILCILSFFMPLTWPAHSYPLCLVLLHSSDYKESQCSHYFWRYITKLFSAFYWQAFTSTPLLVELGKASGSQIFTKHRILAKIKVALKDTRNRKYSLPWL